MTGTSRLKRLLACFAAVVTVLTVMSGSTQPLIKEQLAAATNTDDEIARLEKEAKEKQKEIDEANDKVKELEDKQAELDEKIAATENDIAAEEENQAAIEEQILTVEETLRALESSIETLSAKISSVSEDIEKKEKDIEVKREEIVQGVKDFQKRIRAMYVAGSESYTDILVGASDFYDMLMKLELVKRVADHDNGIIDDLIAKKEQFEADEIKLKQQKQELEADKDDLVKQQEKHETQKDKLDDLYLKSAAMLKQLEADKEEFLANQDAYIAEQEAFEEGLQKLFEEQETIKKQKEEQEEKKKAEEEARRKAEEEARRKAEEEARKKAEAEAKAKAEREAALLQQQQAQQNNAPTTPSVSSNANTNTSSGSSSGSSSSSSTSSGSTSNSAYGYKDKSMFTWPCPGFYYISYGVGWRWGAYHKGIDIYSPGIRGAKICAAADGTVIQVVNGCPHDYGKNYSCGCGGGYGNYCIIDHGGGWWTLYGHSEGITAYVGQKVKQGDVLGTVGSTGHSTGPHLHFEVRLNGTALNPSNYV